MPTHAATASPAPIRVQVVNGDDPFYSHTIPLVALVVACIGTIFGGLALVGIFFQLRKADKGNIIGQLGYNKTVEAIELAQKDYDATQEALAITKEQAALANAERAKKPDLYLTVDHETDLNIREGFHDFHLHVNNKGSAASHGAVVVILWPSDGMEDRLKRLEMIERVRLTTALRKSKTRLWPKDTFETEGGTKVYFFKRQIEQDILMGADFFFANLDVHISKGTYAVNWKITGSDGSTFPSDRPYNILNVTVI